VVLLFCCLFYLCHTNPLVIQRYHLSCTLQGLWTDQLITSRAVLFFVVLFVFVFVCFVLLLFSLFAFLLLHGDSSMDYVSIQFSSLLIAHGRQDWSCHRSNSLNLQNAIVFPVC
jgi:hypothetical protein